MTMKIDGVNSAYFFEAELFESDLHSKTVRVTCADKFGNMTSLLVAKDEFKTRMEAFVKLL